MRHVGEKIGIVQFTTLAPEHLVVGRVAAAEDDDVRALVFLQHAQRRRHVLLDVAVAPGIERISISGDGADLGLDARTQFSAAAA